MRLNRELAVTAVRGGVAEPLGLDPREGARSRRDRPTQMADLIRRACRRAWPRPRRLHGLRLRWRGRNARRLMRGSAAVTWSSRGRRVLGLWDRDERREACGRSPIPRAPFELDRWSARFPSLRSRSGVSSRRSTCRSEALPAALHRASVPGSGACPPRSSSMVIRSSTTAARVIDRFTDLYEAKYGPGTAYRKAGGGHDVRCRGRGGPAAAEDRAASERGPGPERRLAGRARRASSRSWASGRPCRSTAPSACDRGNDLTGPVLVRRRTPRC